MADLTFVDPTTLQPLFTAQQVVCAYPISDLHADSPRYLFYALLAACFVTHWSGWLANVFLGAAATYAGTAAIEAFILRTHSGSLRLAQNVTLPRVTTPLAQNLTDLPALVTESTSISVQPTALDLDIDPVLAICVTGYLVLLPMQCWSRVAKASRVRHILMSIWNLMMLAGAICALTLWPKTLDQPEQYKLCYPSYPDPSPLTNDGWRSQFWADDWNSTIWRLFSNFTESNLLSDNCLYPCFNTSQILRKSTTIASSDYSNRTSPRLNYSDLENRSIWISTLPSLIYLAFGLTAAATFYLLIVSWLSGITRIPAGDPRTLWNQRSVLWKTLWSDTRSGSMILFNALRSPTESFQRLTDTSTHKIGSHVLYFGRFVLDILTLVVLLLAMVLSPVSIIAFIVWIEWYIRHDGYNGETPQQVGQWSSSTAIGLVLVSAIVLRLRYMIAPAEEIRNEIASTQRHLQKLEKLLEAKEKC